MKSISFFLQILPRLPGVWRMKMLTTINDIDSSRVLMLLQPGYASIISLWHHHLQQPLDACKIGVVVPVQKFLCGGYLKNVNEVGSIGHIFFPADVFYCLYHFRRLLFYFLNQFFFTSSSMFTFFNSSPVDFNLSPVVKKGRILCPTRLLTATTAAVSTLEGIIRKEYIRSVDFSKFRSVFSDAWPKHH